MSDYPLSFPVLESFITAASRYVGISYFVYLSLLVLWIIQYFRVKRDYAKFLRRSKLNAIITVISYHIYSLLIMYTAWCNLWAYSNSFRADFTSFVIGSVIGGISGLFYLKVLIQFKSIKRMVGLDTSELITSGIFSKCRNPHTLSKGIAQLGLGIMGRSSFAIIIGLIWWILNHFNVLEEEKLLEKIFGKKYIRYCSNAPRYFNLKHSK